MDRQSLGNKVDICQIGSVGMYYHFYYIAFFLQVYKKNQWEKFFLKCDANVALIAGKTTQRKKMINQLPKFKS